MQEAFAQAAALFQAKKFVEAREACEAALSRQPDNHVFLNLLGCVELRLENYQTATRTLERAIALNPQDSYKGNLGTAHIRLGEQRLLSGDRASAIAAFRSASQTPGLPPKTLKSLQDIVLDTELVIGLLAALSPQTADSTPPHELREAVTQQMTECREMAIVYFHVALDEAHPFASLQGVESKVDYQVTLNHAIATAKRTNPAARIILLTDHATDTSTIADGVAIVKMPVAAGQLMYSRMRGYAALADSGLLRGPVLFLDTDVALNRPFDDVFSQAFDIGLTYRPLASRAHMPFNEGVILAKDGSAAARFFRTCLGLYDLISTTDAARRRYPFDVRHWRGGQLSLAAFTRWETPLTLKKDAGTFHGLNCRFLSCDDFNYTVAESDSPDTVRDKWALHFKGARKHLLNRFTA